MDSEQGKQNKKQTQLNWWFIAIGSILPITIPFIKYFREQAKITPVSLDKQNLFWIAIFAPIVYFFLLGCIAWSGTEIDHSWNGFNKFLEISKLPIGILALSPIFGVFVSNVHRTIQTEKQISATEIQITIAEAKNISDGFYSHNKYIIEELKSIKEKNDELEMSIESPNRLYKKIYTNSNIKNGYDETINICFIKDINDQIGKLNSKIESINCFFKNVKDDVDANSIILILKLMDELDKEILHMVTICYLDIQDPDYLNKKCEDMKLRLKEGPKVKYNFLDHELNQYNKFYIMSCVNQYIFYCTISVALTIEKIFDVINLKNTDELMQMKKLLRDDLKNSYEKLEAFRSKFYEPIEKHEKIMQKITEVSQEI